MINILKLNINVINAYHFQYFISRFVAIHAFIIPAAFLIRTRIISGWLIVSVNRSRMGPSVTTGIAHDNQREKEAEKLEVGHHFEERYAAMR